jgi:hypothetical protein
VDTGGGSTAFSTGSYDTVLAPLSRDYNFMINSLYFPPLITGQRKNNQPLTEISPYDAEMANVPRPIGGTTPAMGFMLAYNQFSRGAQDSDLRTFAGGSSTPYGQAGGLGRNGAQKMIVFETDGVATASVYTQNQMGTMFVANGGPYKSYFKVRKDPSGVNTNQYPTYLSNWPSEAKVQTEAVAQQICNADSTTGLGFSSSRKPVKIHCLAFGSLFSPASITSTNAQNALTLLQDLQTIGGTQNTSPINNSSWKVIYDSDADNVVSKMQTAFSRIMQDGYSITLIQDN